MKWNFWCAFFLFYRVYDNHYSKIYIVQDAVTHFNMSVDINNSKSIKVSTIVAYSFNIMRLFGQLAYDKLHFLDNAHFNSRLSVRYDAILNLTRLKKRMWVINLYNGTL